MKLEDLPAAALEELVDRLSDLRHDLGKYIRFETRFVEGGSDLDALRAALKADLRSTRRRGDEIESAWSVWARMRPSELEGDPDIVAIGAAMQALESADLDGPEAALRRAAALGAEVSEATRRLHGRARARLGEGGHG